MYRRSSNRVFSKGRISEVFERAYSSIKSRVERETEDYILNTNETNYVEYLENEFLLELPELHFDDVSADSYEDDVPVEFFPRMMYRFTEGTTYKKEIIQYFIPCSGDISLLAYSPASIISLGGSGDFNISGNSIVVDIIDFSNDPKEISRSYENELQGIRSRYQNLRKDITEFNNSLKSFIQTLFSQRKEKILGKNQLLSSLGVPLKKKQNVPSTFAVPKPQLREKIVVKPVVRERGFKPEPTLDIENYRKILRIINDVGKNFERMPSVYQNKGEEDLRDHILMTLDPNFEFGSASGETFNRTGKTDIQLRHDSSVVFIAECKFWSGSKNYLATIDQLLSYLTWRDNKASVIVFVRQKDFSAILAKVQFETQNHSNFLSVLQNTDETWFNYRFHLNGDRNRELLLAVQVYNIPSID